ncbi:hypothetical protein NEUTE1DRAFT_140767 [Neurospora tetrasperma FGSC 2508]|uniref:Uncharacterized protein n=1 Tax=Neurospora tetrasperma (strain FGSC 2508 / ATCC MYA-4615 / P0657) TaxID=510951 RepID=F8MXJ2_NEUT8|nr:uncharacterized protein NEUTE1DRAFT_140767 [Neurospora tetrasperma FGSC 2508]EGO54463.1 hypothetical protein NEUTE1DRAFT_140767 [Neurospora tetrasperma FGSC 2508]EGZ68084.1 hypothetical protein NEUTE2DRAFT_132740 [Neurospora tetrasperma FGSC 2509]
MSAPVSVVCRKRFSLGNEDASSDDSSKKRARSSSRTREANQNQFNDVDPFKMNNIKQLINDVAEKIEKSRHASSSHTSEAAMSFGSPSSHTSTKSTTSGQVDFGFGVDTSGDAFTFNQRPVYKELAELLTTSPRARSASPSPEPLQKKRSRTQKRADALRRQKARQQAEKQASQAEAINQAEAVNQAVAAPAAEKRSRTQKRANTKRRQKIREQGERQAKQAEAAKEAEKLRQAKKLQKKLNAIQNNSIPPAPPSSPMLMQLDAQMDEDVEAWSVRLQNELIEAKTEMLSMKRTNDFLMAQVQHLQAKADSLTEANQAALREMQAVRTAAARFLDTDPEVTVEDMERRILNGITAEVPSLPL